jgi:hypothetical protein
VKIFEIRFFKKTDFANTQLEVLYVLLQHTIISLPQMLHALSYNFVRLTDSSLALLSTKDL